MNRLRFTNKKKDLLTNGTAISKFHYQYRTLNFIGQAIAGLIKNIHPPKKATRFLHITWFTRWWLVTSWFLGSPSWMMGFFVGATDFPPSMDWWSSEACWMWGPELLQEGHCLGFNSKRWIWTCSWVHGFAGQEFDWASCPPYQGEYCAAMVGIDMNPIIKALLSTSQEVNFFGKIIKHIHFVPELKRDS